MSNEEGERETTPILEVYRVFIEVGVTSSSFLAPCAPNKPVNLTLLARSAVATHGPRSSHIAVGAKFSKNIAEDVEEIFGANGHGI
jgi:hypothetical protein